MQLRGNALLRGKVLLIIVIVHGFFHSYIFIDIMTFQCDERDFTIHKLDENE